MRCRVATRVRGEGRDHGGLGLRSGGEGIGIPMEAQLKFLNLGLFITYRSLHGKL